LGDPDDRRAGCFRVECSNDEDCASNRACNVRNKCIDPCDSVLCGKGTCQVIEHEPVCTCFEGYTIVNNKCEDIDECLQNPCHPTAICQNTPGNYLCSCPKDTIGDAVYEGCRKQNECFSNAECPESAACIQSKCQDLCENNANNCGENALCKTIDHKISCSCPAPNTYGDPKVLCKLIECSDNSDCDNKKSCINFECIDPCTLPNTCGRNAQCTTINHSRNCACMAGFTGNALLGCSQIQSCSKDNQCPSGTKCNNGMCSATCSNTRECLSDQLCVESICQPTCRTNDSCPLNQYCLNNICMHEPKCLSDDDCEDFESCSQLSNGRYECRSACNGRICGRNAECLARNHDAECQCKPGYHAEGNICRKIECETSDECSNDKKCENHVCKFVCLMNNLCGKNAVCIAEQHNAGEKLFM
jgi:hypothetical protein